MIKFIKTIFSSALVAVAVATIVFGGYTIYAETQVDKYMNFTNPGDGFSSVQNAYHSSMNKYFDDKTEALVKIIEDNPKDFFKKSDFKAAKTGDDCTSTNISSYCVGMGALDLYIAYIETLVEMKDFIPKNSGTTQGQQRGAMSTRDADIDQEIEDARVVMEAAVSVYDEFRMSYPMHKRYEVVIKNLRKYQIALKKLRFEIEEFPLKLIDSTSAQCK